MEFNFLFKLFEAWSLKNKLNFVVKFKCKNSHIQSHLFEKLDVLNEFLVKGDEITIY